MLPQGRRASMARQKTRRLASVITLLPLFIEATSMPDISVALIFMNSKGFGPWRGGDSDISCENYEKTFTVIPARFQKTNGNQVRPRRGDGWSGRGPLGFRGSTCAG